ncbi:MOP flippase family protein [Halotia branconii]|uniref:MOP flippase family protein n=1 Tax=Halotia branconii CENA392 TaxID=1539056 RepID=A0AAJ6NVX2_9CYAN|nr:MOP flippase family protein [Halotia branconii]WGV27607.1 MOP flippase family protein [Halotia branconii CENA392]
MQSPKQSSNLRQKAVKGLVWSAIESWGSQVISFGVFFLLARQLEPKAFGLVALASVFLSFIQLFVDQGLSTAIIQRQELEPEHLDTAFWTNIGISTLLLILSILCASLVADFFNQSALTPIIRWLSFSFLFSALSSVQQAIFQRKLAFKALAIRTLSAVIAGGIVGVTMVFTGFGVWSLVGQQLANGLVQVFTLWGVSDWRPRFKFSAKHFQELFSFGINEVGFNVFNFFSRRGDDFLIGYFLGPIALGYYSVAYRILLVMTQLLISTTSKVALPTFSKIQHDPERMRRAFYSVTQLSSFIAFPMFLAVAALSPELIKAMFGSQWLPSVPVMRVLTFVGLLQSVSFFNNSVILALGKPSWRLGITVLNSVANVMSYILVVKWGIIAVASAFVIRAYLFSPIPVWMIHKLIHINLTTYLQQYITPLISSLVMVVMILGIKYFLGTSINLYLVLTICIVFGTVIYVAMIRLSAPSLFKKVLYLIKIPVAEKMR